MPFVASEHPGARPLEAAALPSDFTPERSWKHSPSSTTGKTSAIVPLVLSNSSATAVPTAIAAKCCSPCAMERYTVDSTSTTAAKAGAR
ncbi:hypothetical protein ACFXMT_34065 [Streptomyces mirabilis]|uniref:hypothetical protein n=1 Tax=Streptomyces mirabilis TaxID=68239 RepID=UPI003687D4DE